MVYLQYGVTKIWHSYNRVLLKYGTTVTVGLQYNITTI